MKNAVLEVKGLTVSFRTPEGKVQAVRDVSFQLEKGQTLAIVGESDFPEPDSPTIAKVSPL